MENASSSPGDWASELTVQPWRLLNGLCRTTVQHYHNQQGTDQCRGLWACQTVCFSFCEPHSWPSLRIHSLQSRCILSSLSHIRCSADCLLFKADQSNQRTPTSQSCLLRCYIVATTLPIFHHQLSTCAALGGFLPSRCCWWLCFAHNSYRRSTPNAKAWATWEINRLGIGLISRLINVMSNNCSSLA